MKELDRRLRVNFLGAAGLKPGEELKPGEKQTVTEKVLISSRRQTLEHELEYSKYVLDTHGELQAPEDVSDSDDARTRRTYTTSSLRPVMNQITLTMKNNIILC